MKNQPIRSFRDLDAWRVAMDLVITVYGVVNHLPPSERFELSPQVRKAAVSVPSNVAEGHALRKSRKTYLRHVRIALGSLAELDTDIELAVRLGLLHSSDVKVLVSEIERTGQLLHGLARSLRSPWQTPAVVAITLGAMFCGFLFL